MIELTLTKKRLEEQNSQVPFWLNGYEVYIIAEKHDTDGGRIRKISQDQILNFCWKLKCHKATVIKITFNSQSIINCYEPLQVSCPLHP